MADPIKITSTTPASSTPEANTAGPTGTAPAYTSKTTITTIEDLQKKAPDVYNMMMKGIAMNIIKDMQRQQDTLSRMTKKMG